jgi:HEPN domain-containing protein
MAERAKEIRRFQRAADQRLATAEFLLEHDFELDAVYLAGYAVECSLKALILRWTPQRELAAMLERLTEAGAKGHDFEYLKGIVKDCRGGREKPDREVLGALGGLLPVVMSWSTDLRYEAGTIPAREAARFLAAARAIRDACAGG